MAQVVRVAAETAVVDIGASLVSNVPGGACERRSCYQQLGTILK